MGIVCLTNNLHATSLLGASVLNSLTLKVSITTIVVLDILKDISANCVDLVQTAPLGAV